MSKPPDTPVDLWAVAAARLIADAPADHRDDLRIIFEERAGICEHDGGLSLSEAERAAFGELRKALTDITARSDAPAESVDGVPNGWSRDSWVRRLEYMIGVCIVPERWAELRRMLEKVR